MILQLETRALERLCDAAFALSARAIRMDERSLLARSECHVTFNMATVGSFARSLVRANIYLAFLTCIFNHRQKARVASNEISSASVCTLTLVIRDRRARLARLERIDFEVLAFFVFRSSFILELFDSLIKPKYDYNKYNNYD